MTSQTFSSAGFNFYYSVLQLNIEVRKELPFGVSDLDTYAEHMAWIRCLDFARRRSFFAWCDERGLDWRSDEANYGYLSHELHTTYASAVSAVLKSSTLAGAVRAFERNFEKAGMPNYASRDRWAGNALDAFRSP